MLLGHITSMLAGVMMQPDSMSLVMEYVPHGNLFQSIQHDSKGTLQWWDRGRHVALDIAKGLAYLHSRRVFLTASCASVLGLCVTLLQSLLLLTRQCSS